MNKYDCPICGQLMDFFAVGNRNSPYIDGNTYPKMCFGCFNAPQEEIQHYNEDGTIKFTEGPFYDHKHIKSAEELYQSDSVGSLKEAKKCIAGIKNKIASTGVRNLNKLKLTRPKAEYEFNPELS